MFKKEEIEKSGGAHKVGEDGNETIIGPTVKVDGDFVSEDNVLVQGVVNGSLRTTGNLRVEKGAKIKANVEAQNAVVRGEIKGNISVQENLELGESAAVEGDIITKILSIEPGAILHGHCSVSLGDKAGAKRSVAAEPAVIQKPLAERVNA